MTIMTQSLSHRSYSRTELLSLRSQSFTLDRVLKKHIKVLCSIGLNRQLACGGRWSRFRGRRIDWNVHWQISIVSKSRCKQTVSRDHFEFKPTTFDVDVNNGDYQQQPNNNLIYPPIQRHVMNSDWQLKLGTFNFANKKIDDVVEIVRAEDCTSSP